MACRIAAALFPRKARPPHTGSILTLPFRSRCMRFLLKAREPNSIKSCSFSRKTTQALSIHVAPSFGCPPTPRARRRRGRGCGWKLLRLAHPVFSRLVGRTRLFSCGVVHADGIRVMILYQVPGMYFCVATSHKLSARNTERGHNDLKARL